MKNTRIKMNPIQEFVAFLHQNNYQNIKLLSGDRWAATMQFMFTTAIVVGKVGNKLCYDDRWCYHDDATAAKALVQWDGIGEPLGWHRHPATGRRRPDGDSSGEYVNL